MRSASQKEQGEVKTYPTKYNPVTCTYLESEKGEVKQWATKELAIPKFGTNFSHKSNALKRSLVRHSLNERV